MPEQYEAHRIEETLLGSMLVNDAYEVIAVCDQIGLTADHFIRPHHGLLYN